MTKKTVEEQLDSVDLDKDKQKELATKSTPEKTVEAKVTFVKPSEKVIKHYERRSWKGIKDVFRCLTCGHFEDNKDNMILHVLRHVPEADRESTLDKLMKR